jgi:hypothetical protein
MSNVETQYPDDPLSVSFARGVVGALQDIAQELSKDSGIKAFCSMFSTALGAVELDYSPQNIPKLLDNLERLCQVRKPRFGTCTLTHRSGRLFRNLSPIRLVNPRVRDILP